MEINPSKRNHFGGNLSAHTLFIAADLCSIVFLWEFQEVMNPKNVSPFE